MQGQIKNMEEGLKDKEGTIETLERQLVQAGIKNKVMQAAIEINKEKEEVKGKLKEEVTKGAATIKEIQATAKAIWIESSKKSLYNSKLHLKA